MLLENGHFITDHIMHILAVFMHVAAFDCLTGTFANCQSVVQMLNLKINRWSSNLGVENKWNSKM